MALKNRLAKLIVDPAFRNPGLLRMIFAIDDFTGIDLVKTLAPFKLVPASAELFQRCFAHFVSGEEISLACATELAALVPDDPAACKYLLIQADEERSHLEHFRSKLAQFGLGEARLGKFVAPNFRRFGEAIEKRIAAGDYVNAFVGNNIVVEGLAICLLELGCRDMRANSDEINKFLDFVLEDERHHVRFGERRLRVWNERGLVNERDTADFYGEMWSYVVGAIGEIPDVINSLGLEPEFLLAEAKTFFEERFAGAGLAITA
jgi:rubrerythrin